MGGLSFTILCPVYNGASTLGAVFESLERQDAKELVLKVIFIDDNSADASLAAIQTYGEVSSFEVAIIHHSYSQGLASSYNEGIRLCSSEFIIFMHQDVFIRKNDVFIKMKEAFANDLSLIATYPTILHPLEVWETYNFWQKCLFARFVGKRISNLTGKFDCFRKDSLESIGGFDSGSFRTAGEDADLIQRMNVAELKVIGLCDLEIEHLHNKEKAFSCFRYLKKEAQLAEARGAVLRRHPKSFFPLKDSLILFFRESLVIGVFIPYFQILTFFLVLAYSVAYTKRVLISKGGGDSPENYAPIFQYIPFALEYNFFYCGVYSRETDYIKLTFL